MSKILLLEPNTLLAQTYKKALKLAGHDVSLCGSAQAAVHALDKTLPDLIITELQLAVHNGLEFLYELRSYAEWQRVPVIILSHLPQETPGLERIGQLNIAAYHYKPLAKLHDLLRSVEQTLVPA